MKLILLAVVLGLSCFNAARAEVVYLNCTLDSLRATSTDKGETNTAFQVEKSHRIVIDLDARTAESFTSASVNSSSFVLKRNLFRKDGTSLTEAVNIDRESGKLKITQFDPPSVFSWYGTCERTGPPKNKF